MAVYLLHFDSPLHHARHYLGGTKDLEQRLAAHRAGTSGVKIMDAAHRAGITFTLARVWDGGFQLERQFKRRKANSRLCPICAKERQQMDPNDRDDLDRQHEEAWHDAIKPDATLEDIDRFHDLDEALRDAERDAGDSHPY